MKTLIHRSTLRTAGFSLVEIMVGMVIGMIGIIVMMQVFSVSEANKRTTTGGDDAQNSGAIALLSVQRDIRLSGYDISSRNLLGCQVSFVNTAGNAITLSAIAPVTINDPNIPAGDANTDTLLVVYGDDNSFPQGDGVLGQTGQTIYSPNTPNLYSVNDWIIATVPTRPTPCTATMEKVVAITPALAPANLSVATGMPGGTSAANGTIFNLGQAPKILAYAIRNGSLTVCDYMAADCGAAGNVGNAAIWVPIASNVVSMRAQYGLDYTYPNVTGSAVVTNYNQTTPTAICGTAGSSSWQRLGSVRIVMVARSSTYEKLLVTTDTVTATEPVINIPTWAGSTADNPAGMTTTVVPIDITKNPDGSANPDWQHYRYKVFETNVPLRNNAWMGVTSGC